MTNKARGIVKKTLIGLLVVLVVIQFFHPQKNIGTAATADDINTIYPVPEPVQLILQKACYDCHSNNTRYPWYNNIQPVAWWMNDHINDAKRGLNFSEFGKYPIAKQVKKLKKSAHEVEEGGMPLNSYTWIHKDAILTGDEKQVLIAWANGLSLRISVLQQPQK